MTLLRVRLGGVGGVDGDRSWRAQRNGAIGGEPGSDEAGEARRAAAGERSGKFAPIAQRGEELRRA